MPQDQQGSCVIGLTFGFLEPNEGNEGGIRVYAAEEKSLGFPEPLLLGRAVAPNLRASRAWVPSIYW